jgi:DNA-binding NarL/FixJ family response regulator
MKPFGIILAEDHILFRNLMRKNIEAFPDLAVIGEAGTGSELLRLLETCQPELVILDISMPKLQGIEAAREIKRNYPGIKILILTMHKSKDHLRSALAARVDGYLLKENAYEDLFTAIRHMQQGKSYLSNLVMADVKEIILQKNRGNKPAESLTTREMVVLKLMAEGKSSREIAALLFVSVATVNRHRFNIKHKLDLRSNADLIKYAIEKGYVSVVPHS